MNITLPYPPTGNHAVRHARGGHYASKALREYRSMVAAEIARQRAAVGLQTPIRVLAEINPPDRRRRDLDNAWKTIADALTHAGVWKDDVQIADLRLIRGEPTGGGAVSIHVEEL